MKITVNNRVVEVTIHTTDTTPRGANYYHIDYHLGGMSLASAYCGPDHSLPSPLDMLDAERTHCVYDYDSLDTEKHRGRGWNGEVVVWRNGDAGEKRGMVGNRRAVWLEQTYTIREKIAWALTQIADD